MDTEYLKILKDEDAVLTDVLEKQALLKKACEDKSWTGLLEVISQINLLMDSFNVLDEQRETLAVGKGFDTEEEKNLLAKIRGKLVKSRTENKVLSEYIQITRGFIQGIIDEALPQKRNKVYTPKGYTVKPQPESVVISRLS